MRVGPSAIAVVNGKSEGYLHPTVMDVDSVMGSFTVIFYIHELCMPKCMHVENVHTIIVHI